MNKELRKLENPLRIKILGECNRNCFFCHQEGGMNIDKIIFSDALKDIIEKISLELNITSIALTGGEPLLYPNLDLLTNDFMSCTGIKQISLTTNGTIYKNPSFWEKMRRAGLYKVNLSIPDILNIADKDSTIIKSNNSIIANQLRMIHLFNDLGITVKINIAVINDYYYTLSVLNYLCSIKDIKCDFVLLPNLTSRYTYSYSEEIIFSIIKKLNFRYVGTRIRNNTSDREDVYEDNHSKRIFVKGTIIDGSPFFLTSTCAKCNCRETCQEGFYGLRLEQKNGDYYIRLCIHKNDNDVVVPATSFFESSSFYELKHLWKN